MDQLSPRREPLIGLSWVSVAPAREERQLIGGTTFANRRSVKIVGLLALSLMVAGCAARSHTSAAVLRGSSGQDSDADTIADQDDGCPQVAETLNRHNDHDGCPDRKTKNYSLLVPGIVVTAMSFPHGLVGGMFVAMGSDSVEGPGHEPTRNLGIALLVIAGLHDLVGVPLIIAGATDTKWSDEPTSKVHLRVDASGVGVVF